MNRVKILIAALVIGASAGGCARNAMNDTSAQPAAEAATLQVTNDYDLSMDIYVRANGHITRLGTVNTGMKDTFVLDPSMLVGGFAEVLAQPPGGGRVATSGNLPIHAGDSIQFEIGRNPTFSNTVIR